ncbi:MAG: STAS domain-containing protein [Burkholderiaceae bacterium]|nr:STAS domain-containing protein [Burkholderiaceae bacterium]
MSANLQSAGDAGAIRMPAEITFGSARAVLEQASAGLVSLPLVFDLSACVRFDSSLIAVLLELARRAAAARRPCAFVGAPDNLRKLSALYGVEDLLFGEHAGRASAADRPGP